VDDVELAKITTKGQVTIPIAVRKRLGVKTGDKLMFVYKPDGVILINPTMTALEKIGREFEGEAERLGLESEDDVVAMIKEIRGENSSKQPCANPHGDSDE
jgi:AbrB family looped-hinge helix DNA binding protein